MKIKKYFLDELGNIYELIDFTRHEDQYVRILYQYKGHVHKFNHLNLDELVEV